MIRVLLATPDDRLAANVVGLAEESAELELVTTARDAAAVTHLLRSGDLDIVLLHEDVGPLPVMDFARELSSAFPEVGIVLLVHEETPDQLRASLAAGVRAVLEVPPALEALDHAARTAADLSGAVRDRLEGAQDESRGPIVIGGTLIAVAGAKGGVGTSTVAVHLALAVARGRPAGTVCLADLDLQSGDLRLLLDLPFKRNIVDLVGLGENLTSSQVDETLYPHTSGIRVLLAPEQGEQGEEVSSPAALQVLGALKLRHAFVVVDVGSVLTAANGLAIKIADQVLVVTTPDIPSLKAANRARAMWQRLEIRDAGVTAVINRSSKDSEIQPVMVRRTLEMPVANAVLPAAFRALEAPLNTGVPERLEGPLNGSFAKLAHEVLDIEQPEHRPRRRHGAAARLATSETGQAATETAALMLIVAVCLLGVWQLVLVGYTYVLSGHAAREASRIMAVGETEKRIEDAAREDVTGAWRHGMRVTVRKRESEVAVRLEVPAIMPGGPGAFTIESTEGAVIEDQPLDGDDT